MCKKIGFIGCGNMGSSMVGGLINKGFLSKENFFVSAKREESKKRLEEKFGVNVRSNNIDIVKESDVIVLAVKPYMYEKVIKEVKDFIRKDQIIVSIAAGIDIKDLENWIGEGFKIVKTMPNTPALVGEAMSAVCPNKNIKEEELKYIISMFEAFGECVVLEEKDFHAFIALCGSSPAYVFMFIEAMADGAVKLGIPRDKAYKMAAQSVLGSAKMVLETKEHPGVLKDMVCSPCGTTIEAVAELENNNFRSTVIKAMDSCANKSKNM